MPQVSAFVKAANVNIEEEFLSRAAAARLAMTKDKDWKHFLQSRKYRDARKKGQTIGKAQAMRLQMLLGGKPDGGK